MRVRLRQHVFAADPIGTVAETEGLTTGHREQLERAAAGYDLERGAVEYRAFALDGGGDGVTGEAAWALSSARRIAWARGNNFLAHAYVLRRDEFEGDAANWAWLTLRLPVLSEFQPSRVSVDRLPLVEDSVDSAPPYRFFRFLVAEQSPLRTAALLEAVLRHVERRDGSPLALEFGPPPTDLPRLLPLTFAASTSAAPRVPSADELTLYRMVGLMAPLPLPFQLAASYVINGAPFNGRCALVATTGATRSELPPSRLLYVRKCLALAEDGREEALRELQAMRAWVGRLLRGPSVEKLEAACALYDLVRGLAQSGARADVALLAAALSALARGEGVPLAEVLEAVAAARIAEHPVGERLALWQALAPAVAAAPEGLPVVVRDDLLEGMASTELAVGARALDLFGRLTHDQQRQLWMTAEAREAPPAFGAPVAVGLACLRAPLLVGNDGEARADRVLCAMTRDRDDALRDGSAAGLAAARLLALAHFEGRVATGVTAGLVDRALRVGLNAFEALGWSRSEAVREFLRASALFDRGRPEQVADVAARAITACWRATAPAVDTTLVVELPALERRAAMAGVLRRVVEILGPPRTRLARLVEVQEEVLEATLAARRVGRAREILLQVPRYAETIEMWREERRRENRPPDERGPELYIDLHAAIVAEVRAAPTPAAVLLGASYLSHRENHAPLLSAIVERAQEVAWFESDALETRRLRAIVLAELLAASQTCRRLDLMSDVASVLMAAHPEAEALFVMVGSILGEHRREPPAWQEIQKGRRGRSSIFGGRS